MGLAPHVQNVSVAVNILVQIYKYTNMYIDVHVTALGVLCCFAMFVCLPLLASFFLPSHLSFKNMYTLPPTLSLYFLLGDTLKSRFCGLRSMCATPLDRKN